MSPLLVALYGLLGITGLIGSALFSGLETGTYTLNRVRLHVYAHEGIRSAQILDDLISHPNRLLGTLLISNNIANFLATYAIGVLLEFAGYSGAALIIINAAILTPLLFIFGEVLPKDLFRAHSDRLTYYFARPLAFVQATLKWSGLLPLIDIVSFMLKRLLHARGNPYGRHRPRRIVSHLMKESVGHGVLSIYQSDMIDRVLRLDQLSVRDVMIPWRQVTTVKISQPAEAVWMLADRIPHARVPLLDAKDRPIGILNVDDVLKYPPNEGPCPPLQSLAQPHESIDPDESLHEALLHLQRRHVPLALVMENALPIGLVTTKDLVEPIVGQLSTW